MDKAKKLQKELDALKEDCGWSTYGQRKYIRESRKLIASYLEEPRPDEYKRARIIQNVMHIIDQDTLVEAMVWNSTHPECDISENKDLQQRYAQLVDKATKINKLYEETV